jgi:hypothetical protein
MTNAGYDVYVDRMMSNKDIISGFEVLSRGFARTQD